MQKKFFPSSKGITLWIIQMTCFSLVMLFIIFTLSRSKITPIYFNRIVTLGMTLSLIYTCVRSSLQRVKSVTFSQNKIIIEKGNKLLSYSLESHTINAQFQTSYLEFIPMRTKRFLTITKLEDGFLAYYNLYGYTKQDLADILKTTELITAFAKYEKI